MDTKRLSVFDYQDSIRYLNERIRSFPKRGHGIQRKLAQATHCQSTYVSRVLKGQGHFNLEQAAAINAFLGHTEEESHFYLLLVQSEKAGTPVLRSYFQKQMSEVLQRRLVLKNRLAVTQSLSESDQVHYYSQWYFAAIHIALTIQELQTREALARYFRLPLARVTEVLDFLMTRGLAQMEGARYQIGVTRIHLGADSPLISKSHINWRLRAIQSLERGARDDLHYSSVVSVSRKDLLKIKSELVDKIESLKQIIKESPAEEMACFAIDFFKVSEE